MMTPLHLSVLLDETVQYLNVLSNHHYVDCTLGGGGHTEAILERNGPHGIVIAFERDADTISRTKKHLRRFGKRLIVIEDNFRNLERIANYELRITGILYDLGISMDLLKSSDRGFSFLHDEPLDMRFSLDQETTAEDLVQRLPEQKLADLIFQYGEERFSRRIARALVKERQRKSIDTTGDLVAVIESAVPPRFRHARLHCATRTFQALRIAVNDELGALEESLQKASDLMESGGRIVVLSFHSLEDRIVKQFFRKLHLSKKGIILTKKPIPPSAEEFKRNPAARSAKLRALEIL